MKSVELVPLQEIAFDFRDLLDCFDRNIFKEPFIPKNVWRNLGKHFNLKEWNKKLEKYRVQIVEVKTRLKPRPEVLAIYHDEECKIDLTISNLKLFSGIEDLKFGVIQTIMHEMIHANQFFRHPDAYSKVIEEQEKEYENYHAKFGEVEAFSHCIALEYLREGRWGAGNTLRRYKNCSPKIQRLLHKNTKKWVEVYHENL